jgi:hypothetical protein
MVNKLNNIKLTVLWNILSIWEMKNML